mgnify:CR=1 FL=1
MDERPLHRTGGGNGLRPEGQAGEPDRMKLLSWNVNGVRAALGKGLLDWMKASQADVICLQEVQATPGDGQGVAWPAGYEMIWNAAQK